MIKYKYGNILTATTDAIVNPVNCVGVMGAGLALQYKKIFPDNFQYYADACKQHKVVPGKMLIFDTHRFAPRYIINFPTKRHWKELSRMEDIVSGLEALKGDIIHLDIHSVAIPALGCGLGGLDWHDVRTEIINILGDISNTTIEIYSL